MSCEPCLSRNDRVCSLSIPHSPSVKTSCGGPKNRIQPSAMLLMIVVVLVATGLVLKLYEAFNGVGGDIADQIHGDVTPDS